MSKKLILLAQRGEAEVLLHHLQATPIEQEIYPIWSEGPICCRYQFEEGWIVISNVGIHAAQMAVAKHAHLCDEVWNIGFAGALNKNVPIGELYTINTVGKHIPINKATFDPRTRECLNATLPHFQWDREGKRLISSDFPIHHADHRLGIDDHWDCVDMEGYGIAYACHTLKKTCRMWKLMSDFASPGGRELIRHFRLQLSEKIAEAILSHLAAEALYTDTRSSRN